MSDRIDAIKARLEAATPGPWKWVEHFDRLDRLENESGAVVVGFWTVYADDAGLDVPDLDMEFIAHSRDDVSHLLRECERLRAELNTAYDLLSSGHYSEAQFGISAALTESLSVDV
jgi:hypothetical protein